MGKVVIVVQLNLANKSALGKSQTGTFVICECAVLQLASYLSQEFLRSLICHRQRKMNASVLWSALGIKKKIRVLLKYNIHSEKCTDHNVQLNQFPQSEGSCTQNMKQTITRNPWYNPPWCNILGTTVPNVATTLTSKPQQLVLPASKIRMNVIIEHALGLSLLLADNWVSEVYPCCCMFILSA